MGIIVKVHPGSSQRKIVEKDNLLEAYIYEVAEDGKANKAVVELLSEYLNVPKSKITLARGLKSRMKDFEIRA